MTRPADQQQGQPGINLQILRQRAKFYRLIREFFNTRHLLEVNTPILSLHGVSDPYIQSLKTHQLGAEYYLQSSPEFAMKRLLAEGSGPIYQIFAAFRAGEAGRFHNPEFAMLEWYQPRYSLTRLMDELSGLFETLAEAFNKSFAPITICSYRSLFEAKFNLNPHAAGLAQLRTLVETHLPTLGQHIEAGLDAVDQYRDLLFSELIEVDLHAPTLVTDFPASQAALAKVELVDGDAVAKRFECYWLGLELANGYDELTDSEELRRRIRRDNQIRHEKGLIAMAADERLLAAMAQMPDCVGVAVGLDRLLMLLTDKNRLSEVLAFPIDEA